MTKLSDNSQSTELEQVVKQLEQRLKELEAEKVSFTQVYCVADPTIACFLTHTYLPGRDLPLPNSWAIEPKEEYETLDKLYTLALTSVINSHATVFNQVGTHLELHLEKSESDRVSDDEVLNELKDSSPVPIFISPPPSKKRYKELQQDLQRRIDNASSQRPDNYTSNIRHNDK